MIAKTTFYLKHALQELPRQQTQHSVVSQSADVDLNLKSKKKKRTFNDVKHFHMLTSLIQHWMYDIAATPFRKYVWQYVSNSEFKS